MYSFLSTATIALHLFTESERRHYNIESLWIFGPEIDALHRVDPLDEIMANHDFDLDDLEPSRR